MKNKKRIGNRSRHVRWNWELSSESGLVRYHIVVVDDKARETVIRRFLEQIQKYGFIERVRKYEGKVIRSRLRYLLESYDTPIAPRMINLSVLRKPIKRDENLRERRNGSIEDYVVSIYEN